MLGSGIKGAAGLGAKSNRRIGSQALEQKEALFMIAELCIEEF
ncbi:MULTISPECIES: hypothetical protein [unclassified Endozoicomonas]